MTEDIRKSSFPVLEAAFAGASHDEPSTVPTGSNAGVGAVAGRVLTPVTYLPVPMQQQLLRNQEAIREKPYEEFFQRDLTVPVDWAKALQQGPMPPEQTLTPSIMDINKILDPSFRYPDAGYALLDGPTAYTQARIEMAGVTTDMFKWWFLWHPLEKERYSLWFPQAHIDNYVVDPTRLADASLSYEQRLYGNPNHIEEFIGPSSLKLVLHFTDPVELGFDAAALRRAGIKASASATIRVADTPDTTFMFMLHLARDTDRGMELFSRYWIGAHPEFKRFPGGTDAPALLRTMGMDRHSLETLAYELSVHDMTEFSHLAKILPALHRAFRN